MQVVEKAPAKINLSLDALYRHEDGQHEWEMVMTSIDLADYVRMTLRSDGHIIIKTDSGFIPEDRRNLAFQAAQLLQERFRPEAGALIEIEKHIPVAAGLGGGSSDAAAVLRGLNRLWQLGLTQKELAQLGLLIDSDVPYCVYSQTALVTGKGDQITLLPPLPPCWFVVVKPAISVSTVRLLRTLNYSQLTQHPDNQALIEAIRTQDNQKFVTSMANTLTAVTTQRYPQVSRLMTQLERFGAHKAQMSGTGPTVFGLCWQQSRAQRIYNSMAGFCKEVYLVQPLR